MIRSLLVAAVAAVTLALPTSALAGGQAYAGITDYAAFSNALGHTGADFTTGNGVVYQLRSYLQSNETGSYGITTSAVTHQIYNSGSPIPNNKSYRYTDAFACSQIPASATRLRVKVVLENAVTNTIDVAYGPSAPRASNCHG